MPLINNAFSIIALLIYASALINNDFMPLVARMVAHWCGKIALYWIAPGSRQDRASIYQKIALVYALRLYAVWLYQLRLI